MSSNEVQAILAALRGKSQTPNASSSSEPVHDASGSFPAASMIPSTPPPPFSSSNVVSSQASSNAGHNAAAQNLLSLLNFGGNINKLSAVPAQPPSAPAERPTSTQQNGKNTNISASDLVARLVAPPAHTQPSVEKSPESSPSLHEPTVRKEPNNPLLSLLNKQSQENPKVIAQNGREPTAAIPSQYAQEATSKTDPTSKTLGSTASRETTPLDPSKVPKPTSPPGKPIFTYINPFEALKASLPQTPKHRQPSTSDREDFTATSRDQSLEAPIQESIELQPQDALTSSDRKKLVPKSRSKTSPNREQSAPPQTNEMAKPVDPMHTIGSPAPQYTAADTPPTTNAKSKQTAPQTASRVESDAETPVKNAAENTQHSSRQVTSPSADETSVSRIVPVYNFPIRAFVSLTLHPEKHSDVGIRPDGILEISRLKKDFDQLDRSLATATWKYITYAFTKNGGMRIIRQDDGSDRHVFKNSHDRIFHVAFCTTATTAPPTENQAILGVGVSGDVYYATVSKDGNDLFEKNKLDSESLVFTAHPHGDENPSGAVLKTRAKRSARHPEFFAIGRGKSIQIVWPETAMSPRYGVTDTNRRVDTEKFFRERCLQISTGKAVKDFAFSEDDTTVVSLDKTGRLRFWDITQLTHEPNALAPRIESIVVETPTLSLSTASPSERSWPTSVLFVDKVRPYNRGAALRYVLVGLRQNHTLQLWDIALGRAVQELSFPHTDENDGICSVVYHAQTGIIVVGHPTRNSLFFIHVSVPRYAIPTNTTQSSYVQRVAAKDSEVPKPESTICMTGVREVSFTGHGQLRSVDILSVVKPNSSETSDEAQNLFELYVAHSKGVTCLTIAKEDLGWDTERKAILSVDAEKERYVSLRELKAGSVIEESPASPGPSKEISHPVKAVKKKTKKAVKEAAEVTPPAPVETREALHTDAAQEATPQPATDRVEPETEIPGSLTEPDLTLPDPIEVSEAEVQNALKVEEVDPPLRESTLPNGEDPKTLSLDGHSKTQEREVLQLAETKEAFDLGLKTIETGVVTELKKEFEALHKNIQNDRATQDEFSASRQEAILRLVSSSLSTNVEKSLARILAAQMHEIVVPTAVTSVTEKVSKEINEGLRTILPREIQRHITPGLGTALRDLDFNKNVSKDVASSVAIKLEEKLTTTLQAQLKYLTTTITDQTVSIVESRLSTHLQAMTLQQKTQDEKMAKFGDALEHMANTLQAMSDAQLAFQQQILKDRQQLELMATPSVTSSQVSTARPTLSRTPSARAAPAKPKDKADVELEEINRLMSEGRYEEGSIRWLQSSQPVKLFDNLFVRFTPEYLATDVSPLVAFSIAVTVATSLDTNMERRLEWILAAFDASKFNENELTDLSQHAPQLMSSLIQRLESLYMTKAETNAQDPSLRAIAAIAKKAREIKSTFQAHGSQQSFDESAAWTRVA